MTKTKILTAVMTVAILAGLPRTASATTDQEPSFTAHFSPTKEVSSTSLDAALSNHPLEQLGHGLLVVAIAGILARRKRR